MTELPAGTVTLLFSDIEGSTRLLQRAGDAYAELLAEHRRLLRESFERHDGHVVDADGDAFFVAFASASDAVAAAADAQRALAGHRWPEEHEIRVRMGLHTGEPQAIDGRYVGLDVHHGARVMAVGHGGQVLVSESTRALLDESVQLRDLGEHRLKDLSGPQRLYQLQIDGLDAEFPPLNTLANRPTNLPVLANALVGRDRELEEARELLAREDVRLLTLTGAGGTGKTRLALQVAAEQLERFANGVFFVSLAPVRDWELVVPTIAQTLGLREQPYEPLTETVTDYLRSRQTLLLLDNFEQVVAAAATLSGLLASAPGLTVLATSRTPLRLSGEQTYPVPPLDREQAVRLFVERAQAAVPGFELDGNADAVTEICERLDGLPLAIELAAPRVRTLPPPALLRRLDQRLGLLTGGARDADERQRTLRATVEWSYELLIDSERTLFSRLGVFIGGSRLDAAEALCDPDGELGIDLLDGLESLVDKSLLLQRPDPDGEPRFWMLETIREFALERLAADDALEDARERYARYFRGYAEQIDVEARTGDQAALFALLEADNANFRAALDWAQETRAGELMLGLATALARFWIARGHVAEGQTAFDEAFALTEERPAPALLAVCTLRILGGKSGEIHHDAEAALEAAKQLGDDFSLAQAWNLLGRVDSVRGRMEKAEHAWWEALAHAERGGFAAEQAESVGWLMISAVFGPLPAPEGIERAKRFYDTSTDPTVRAWCQMERSVLEALQGRFELARELLAEGRRTLEELGLNLYAVNSAQEGFFVEMLAGEPRRAADGLRASFDTLERMGERGFLSTVAALLAHALHALGEDEEAERFSRASEDTAAEDDVFSQALWRTALAKVEVGRGELERAETLVREAMGILEPTDLLNVQADTWLDLAEILRLQGRPDEAREAAEEAARRYERKGNLPSLARATSLAGELPA